MSLLDFKSIGVVGLGMSTEHNQPNFFDDVLRGILQGARGFDRDVTVIRHSLWEPADVPPLFSSQHYIGLILLGPSFPAMLLEGVDLSGLPVVTIGGAGECPGLPSVDVDNYRSAKAAIQHLIDLDHRRIGYVSGESIAGWASERHRAYVDAMMSAGIPVEERLIARVEVAGVNEGYEAACRLLSDRSEKITAVATVNDDTAYGVLSRLCETGSRIPAEVSVIGFDDNLNSAASVPPLSTIRQPKHAIGAKAVQILMTGILTRFDAVEHAMIPGELVIRASTGRLSKSQSTTP